MAAVAPAVLGLGSGIGGLIQAQAAPAGSSTEVLNYGAVGVLGMAFLYMIYALSQNRIVSRDAADHEKRLTEIAAKLIDIIEDGNVREDQLRSIAERQMSWLEGKGGRGA